MQEYLRLFVREAFHRAATAAKDDAAEAERQGRPQGTPTPTVEVSTAELTLLFYFDIVMLRRYRLRIFTKC